MIMEQLLLSKIKVLAVLVGPSQLLEPFKACINLSMVNYSAFQNHNLSIVQEDMEIWDAREVNNKMPLNIFNKMVL